MKARARGVGLVEILVALVLVSIGFLSVAQLQINGLRFGQSARNRSQAAFLATAMIDRIRSNVDGTLAGHYDDLRTSADAIDPGCDDHACTPAEIAVQDLHDWSVELRSSSDDSSLATALPSIDGSAPSGRIERLFPGIYRVTVSWQEIIDGAQASQNLSMTFVAETRG